MVDMGSVPGLFTGKPVVNLCARCNPRENRGVGILFYDINISQIGKAGDIYCRKFT